MFILIVISAYHSAILIRHSTKPLHWFLLVFARPHPGRCRQLLKGELNVILAYWLFLQISSAPRDNCSLRYQDRCWGSSWPMCRATKLFFVTKHHYQSIQFRKSASFSVASRAKEVQGKWDGPGPKSGTWHAQLICHDKSAENEKAICYQWCFTLSIVLSEDH